MWNGMGLTPFTKLSDQRQNEYASLKTHIPHLDFIYFLSDRYGLLKARQRLRHPW